MSTFEFSKNIFLLHMEENAYKFQLTTLTIPNLWLSSKLVRIFPSHFNSVHCFWFFNMLGPRRIFSFISFLNPHFLCSSTKRKKGKKNWKLYQFFKNQERLKLIPKHCDSMNFVMIIKSRLLYILYMLSTERWKMKEKQTILQKIQKKIQLKNLKKNRSAREKKFVYLLIYENNKKKQKLLLSLSILVVFWSILHTTFFDFLVLKKNGKRLKNKRKIKTNLSGIH